MTIEYLADPTSLPDFTIPHVEGQSALSCPVVTVAAPAPALRVHAPEAAALVAGASVGEATCACKGKKKPCLFVHGVGNKDSSAPTPTFSESWGDIQNSAPCCSSVAFAHYESVLRGWTRKDVQTEFCNTALKVGTSGGKTIDNMILVTFSMGNLIASGAFANGTCNIGSGVTWVSIAGPMQGSKASNLLEEKCTSGGWSATLGVFGYCPATESYLQMKYQDTVDASLKKAYLDAQTARKRANKLMCGIKSSGLASTDGAALALVGSMAFKDGSLHDGNRLVRLFTENELHA
ncbi:hypothetical protein SDRG_13402 [Saprolegnia diclina VS20]|uniref:Uncharacterized protein n=1 Tax=Saprolegnia diclina (strain VS20) TaxID=1156394 RepID=T0RGN1_SAPDV|nr:hypothetical protein SDRG_13402 [Saprolegnia diclina VS20]EQC28892.1 hypothetical protein SDRG_13402 [Saprolegnia diclina VS20]|eukprot:XP_008617709.1 hypothetical protein SDRG_13402 [Saprolegnia diclina VS20]